MQAFPRRGARAVAGVGSLAILFSSCAPEFDSARRPVPVGTVGNEVFNVLCERVHTGETPVDVAFENGRPACTTGLGATAPAPRGVGPKTTALARMRRDVVASLDTAMPRDTYTPLDRLLINLLPLYGPDGSRRVDAMRRPLILTPDGGTALTEDLLPQTTRALSALVTRISTDQEALLAMERMSLRRGYRPVRVGFGLLRPVLAYERVDDLLDTTFRLFRDQNLVAPAGTANTQFNTMLATLRGEFADARASTAEESVGGTTLDATINLMFRTDDAAGVGAPVEIVRRNTAGFAQINGPVAAPFVDSNSDGVIDTVRGVPVNAQRQPLRDAPAPFPASGAAETPRDAAARATITPGGDLRYQFVNLNASMLGAVARQLPPLLTGAEPPALQLLHGAQGLLGTRAMSSRMYSSGPVAYQQFTAQGSPVIDLVHGVGVLLTHKDAPAILNMARQLMAGQNEQRTARLIGAMLAVKAISDRHPSATMEHRSVVWDDVMTVVRRIAEEPGLLEDVLDGMVASTTPLQSSGLWESSCSGTIPLQNLARAFGGYMGNRDRVEPNWSDTSVVGGFPAWNQPVIRTFSQAVDRAQPDTADWMRPGTATDNRSLQQRLFHLVDDLNGASMCNKNHAAVRIYFTIPLIGTRTSIPVPGAGDIPACGLVQIPDAATFFLRSVVGGRRAVMPMSLPGLAGAVTDIARTFGLSLDPTLDGLVQSQSEIRGFSSMPSPHAVARLVFHPRPNAFVTGLLDPVMMRNAEGATATSSPESVIRNYHRGTLFAWESACFYDSVRPLASAFVRHDRNTLNNRVDPQLMPGDNPATMAPANIDSSRGAKLFAELFTAFHRHWPTARSGDMQSSTRCATCREGRNFANLDGGQRYEPILTEALAGDLLNALGDITVALRDIDPGAGSVCLDRARPGQRRRCNGLDATAALIRALVMPTPTALDGTPAFTQAASSRDGSAQTLWCDGTTRTDTTLFTLFADAFNAMDPLLAADATRQANWNSARSATVDQLLTVDGAGTSSQLRNRAMAPITRMLVSWLGDRVQAHRDASDLNAWARDGQRGLGARLSSVIQGPGFASGVDLGLALYADRPARDTMGAFVTHLLSDNTIGDPTRAGTNFATTVSAVGDILQTMRADQDIDPFLRVIAPALEPRTGTVPVALRFFDRARGYDSDRILTRVLGNMARRPVNTDPLALEPLSVVADAISDTHRQTPGDHGPLNAMDFHLVLRNLAEFFSDNRRGLEQFYSIVQQRRLPQ